MLGVTSSMLWRVFAYIHDCTILTGAACAVCELDVSQLLPFPA